MDPYFTKADLEPYTGLMIEYVAYQYEPDGRLIEYEEVTIESLTDTMLICLENHEFEREGAVHHYDSVILVPIALIVELRFYRDID